MVTWLCNGYRDKEEAMTHSFIPSANIYWVLKYECLDTEVRGYADVWHTVWKKYGPCRYGVYILVRAVGVEEKGAWRNH